MHIGAPLAARAIQLHANATKNVRNRVPFMLICAALIVASGVLSAADPPPGFLRKIAERETENARARENYTFRQSVSVQEIDIHGGMTGEYGEVRDVTFLAAGWTL